MLLDVPPVPLTAVEGDSGIHLGTVYIYIYRERERER